MPGYIKLYRDLRDHWIWKIKRKFSKAEAWIDIMFRCNHKCAKMPDGYGVKYVLRGEFISSNYELAVAWGWSEATVRKFMKQLENDGMILVRGRAKNSTYSVTNYCVYQSLDMTELELYGIRAEYAQSTRNVRTEYAQRTPNNNDNNDNTIYNNNTINNTLTFSTNITLTPDQHKALCNKFGSRDAVLHATHYICVLSKMKSEGYQSDNDFAELVKLIDADRAKEQGGQNV